MSHAPLLCAFDAGHRHFVCVTHDHRIKLWDVTTGTLLHQHQPPHHLTASYTSLAWTLTHPATHNQPSSSSSSAHPLGYLILGSQQGHLTLIDLSTGDSSTPSHSSTPSPSSPSPTLPRTHSSPILALTLHPPTSQLFTSTADSRLHRYAYPSLTLLSSLPTPSPITLLPSLPLPTRSSTLLPLALGPSLALLDLSASPSTFDLHRRFTPTSSDLCSIAVSEDAKLYATGQPPPPHPGPSPTSHPGCSRWVPLCPCLSCARRGADRPQIVLSLALLSLSPHPLLTSPRFPSPLMFHSVERPVRAIVGCRRRGE